MLKNKRFILSLTVLAACCGLSACSKSDNTAPPAASQPQAQQNQTPESTPTYTVAIDPYYPPFEYRSEDGSIIGFDVDLLDAIAEKQNFKIKYVPRKILTIVDAVKDGENDIGNSSIFILEERRKIIDYSDPYFVLPLVFAGEEKAGRPQTIEEIKGKRIAVQKDIIMEDIVDEYFAKDGLNQKVAHKTNFLALKDVLGGNSDIILDNVVSMKHFKQAAEGKPLFALQLPDKYSLRLGFVVQKGNTKLLNKLNRGIASVKADGTYQKIYDKWFGKNSQQPLDIDQLSANTTVPEVQSVK